MRHSRVRVEVCLLSTIHRPCQKKKSPQEPLLSYVTASRTQHAEDDAKHRLCSPAITASTHTNKIQREPLSGKERDMKHSTAQEPVACDQIS